MMTRDDLLRQTAAERTAVEAVITQAAQDIAAKVRRAGDLELAVQPAEVAVIADHLQKTTAELVNNGCKFSSPGTTVRVAGVIAGKNDELTVTDAGRGMTAEQIAKIAPQVQFERNIYEQQGAGLDLIIARRLT